jgi:hypothetical protein
MKLKCVEHNQRVYLILGQNAVHRNGGSVCRSLKLVLGDKTFVRGPRGYEVVGKDTQ